MQHNAITGKMKFNGVLLLIFTTSFSLYGQDCDCLKNIQLLQQKIENNQASYQHQVIEQKRENAYARYKSAINKQAVRITNTKDCIGLVSLYLSFFRDEHSFIAYMDNPTPQPNGIVKPAGKRNKVPVPFAGRWYFQDGSFSINVIPAKTTFGDWVALIDTDKSASWKKGMLKIEFIRNPDGSYHCIYWRQNLLPKALNVTYSDSALQIGRNLVFYRQQPAMQENSAAAISLQFESLSENTNYIRIPSFDLSYKNKIDSLLTKNRHEIHSRKNLIIDLRNNGGGGFDAFQPLLPYVLDTTITETPFYGSVWVSEDNYAYYDSTKYEYAETKQDSIEELKYVEFLNANRGRFTPTETAADTIQLESNPPANIAIIFNRNTASTAEGFILQAKKSGKVQTYGENSAGAVSYGDWMPEELPDLNIWVAITTKKMIFRHNEDFESIGIAPAVNLADVHEKEWVRIILEKMEE